MDWPAIGVRGTEATTNDAVVIGAGPNGLVAANHLADAGWSVLVLEAAGEPGGAARTAELTEPGFHHDIFSAFYPLAAASPAIGRLGLEDHGLSWCRAPLVLAHPFPDGRCAVVSSDLDETAGSLEAFAAGDGAAWRRIFDEWQRVADPLIDAALGPFPPVRAVGRLVARLGARDTARLARHLLLPVRRMAEERFAGEGGAVVLGGNAMHADLAPEAAGSGAYGWLLSCLAQQVGFPVPRGGAAGLTGALVARLEAHGGSVRCSEPVTEVVVRAGRAVGVRTLDGATHAARRAVLADVSAPALYRQLLASDHLPADVLDDVGRFEWDPATVKVDWSLDGSVPWTAPEARRAGTVHVADGMDDLTGVAADLATGRLPARPMLICGQQSLADPSRCPPGTSTLWAYTHVPRTVRGDAAGELATARGELDWLDGFVDRLEERVERLAPGFVTRVRHRHVLSPSGLEAADANLVGGAIGGGTCQLHQQGVFRPVPGSGRPETPVAGLYLASASAHPGAGVHGAAGANAARAAMRAGARPRSWMFGGGSPPTVAGARRRRRDDDAEGKATPRRA
ncbi:MAG TPA: NAD(P)/FAD-dependent oxidoreductase [Acidimicrobiales bacterium]|nr:NAD(P)/FAD-dependent oxidoreductase [Acidimicrobiales bacterium]